MARARGNEDGVSSKSQGRPSRSICLVRREIVDEDEELDRSTRVARSANYHCSCAFWKRLESNER